MGEIRAIELGQIQMDTSIQCRASINSETVTDYAECMTEGNEFPPVVLFGVNGKFWIADGWHRIMAAKQVGYTDIQADVMSGGRVEALKYALSANTSNGMRRTNEDKKRCVEIALAEFGNLSSRAIAEMCGVSDRYVGRVRDVSGANNAHLTGKDGKQYPASKRKPEPEPSEESIERKEEEKEVEQDYVTAPHGRRKPLQKTNPCVGLQFARMAIMDLEKIEDNDTERRAAFNLVKGWLKDHE